METGGAILRAWGAIISAGYVNKLTYPAEIIAGGVILFAEVRGR